MIWMPTSHPRVFAAYCLNAADMNGLRVQPDLLAE